VVVRVCFSIPVACRLYKREKSRVALFAERRVELAVSRVAGGREGEIERFGSSLVSARVIAVSR
jgi:hypothetical protein